jgi:hypothetical protein
MRKKQSTYLATPSNAAITLSKRFNVSPKTIRDIWNRATWVKATRHAWTVEEEADYVQSQSAISRASDGNSTSTDHDATRSSESEVRIPFFFPACVFPEHSVGVVGVGLLFRECRQAV